MVHCTSRPTAAAQQTRSHEIERDRDREKKTQWDIKRVRAMKIQSTEWQINKENFQGNNNRDTFIWSSLPYIYVQQILNQRIIQAHLEHGADDKSAAYLFCDLIFLDISWVTHSVCFGVRVHVWANEIAFGEAFRSATNAECRKIYSSIATSRWLLCT